MQWHKAAVSWFGTTAQKNKAGSFPNYCTSALVTGDCTQSRYSQVKMQWHKAAVSRLGTGAQKNKHTDAEIFIGKNAVAQGCCQLVWHSSTEEQGRQFT